MKIENYNVQMHSEHHKSTTVISSFVTELDSQNLKRAEALEAVEREMQLCQRLEYELIEQLIFSLQSRNYRFKKLDIEQLQQRDVHFYEEKQTSEQLDVSMSAFVQTATQKIEIDMSVSFSHTFVSKYEIERSEFYDPLVISFDDTLPDLSDHCFSFDIDCDGEREQLSQLKEGSGFLALDSNGNNQVDNGSELFGTKNGNGFADLARYDSDNNGWIDENDPILDKLRIWIKSENESRLVALGEVGIGALYLGYSANPFEIKNDSNETLGRIRSSGLYLNENGSSGLVTQIDFAHHDKQAGRKLQVTDLQELLKVV